MSMFEFDEYGEQKNQKNIPIVTFWVHHDPDEAASKREGRPIVISTEMVTIAYPADRSAPVRPAHSQWTKIGEQVITYVDRFPDHYRRFKANEPQVVEGTPIAEAPFLTMNQREVLKRVHPPVYTVEQLASLSGDALKNLGPGGFEQQQKAAAYSRTPRAAPTSPRWRKRTPGLRNQSRQWPRRAQIPRIKYVETTEQALKDLIKEKTGEYPRGNPSRQTLVRMLVEAERGPVPEAQAAA